MGRREVGLADAVWSGVETLGTAQQRTWVLVVRVAAAISIVVGWVALYQTPAQRTVDDLFAALDAGEVTQVTVERPELAGIGSGSYQVRWEGEGRPGRASYDYSTEPGLRVDEGAQIVRAAESSGARVEVTADHPVGGTTWSLHGIGALVALVLLVGGTAPRLASRWAWFWLLWSVPPAALVFVLVEPVPLWRRGARPATRRLTGGWAFLLALMLANTLPQLPLYGELFPAAP
ncbi:hypothetical protein SAMN05216184_101824 [Georgenia satyanarayanai]|uniref:Uncharacterized protein n=1 Tax=Georgenia satyanarayanai TaxID=860221 RepID=A0A2Y8ZYI7_9MICO|nr:hypothetical protein [Georgenia satyanarayanai]PYG02351.1 hypothetical protein A8987_101824 [Georgenia satyanarayanai]SSA37230.1 hypothetical protein SAMN05216184_101824 [Georgenia satyanarayanai]